MLPPVEEAVLRNNPDFATLYTTLTTVILNPDGSTKTDSGAKERAAVKEDVKKARLRAAKNHLLAQAISTTAPPPAAAAATDGKQGVAARRAVRAVARTAPSRAAGGDLPPELMDLLLLLPPLMHLANGGSGGQASLSPPSSTLSAEEVELLLSSPPFTSLPEHLPRLTTLVSENLQASALGLARVVHPSTNPSYLHRTVPSLPTQVAALQEAVSETKTKLAAARHTTATTLLALLDQQATALASLLRTLEAKHGPIARSLELRAAEVALDAQASEVDAQNALSATCRAVYPPEASAALRQYASHLRDSRMRLDEELRERKALLQEYGVDDADEEAVTAAADTTGRAKDDKARTMREMARVYREMGQQVQDVNGDLARLART